MLRPPVGGTSRERYLSLLCLILGTAAGGAALGTLVISIRAVLGMLSAGTTGIGIGMAALALCTLAFPSLERWLPERPCQVRRSVLFRHSKEAAALRWGFQLGLGVCTYFVTPAFLGLLAATMMVNSLFLAWLSLLLYGFIRGTVIAASAVAKGRPESPGLPDDASGGGLRRALLIPSALAITASAVLAVANV